MAESSSCGKTVDVSAPGVRIRSWVINGRYARFTGTSMACPFVSGAAACLGSAGLDPEEQRKGVQSGAEDTPTPAHKEGNGALDALAAYKRFSDKPEPEPVNPGLPRWARRLLRRLFG